MSNYYILHPRKTTLHFKKGNMTISTIQERQLTIQERQLTISRKTTWQLHHSRKITHHLSGEFHHSQISRSDQQETGFN